MDLWRSRNSAVCHLICIIETTQNNWTRLGRSLGKPFALSPAFTPEFWSTFQEGNEKRKIKSRSWNTIDATSELIKSRFRNLREKNSVRSSSQNSFHSTSRTNAMPLATCCYREYEDHERDSDSREKQVLQFSLVSKRRRKKKGKKRNGFIRGFWTEKKEGEKEKLHTCRANRASLIRAHSPVQKLFEGEPSTPQPPPTKARRLRLLERRDSKRGVGGRRVQRRDGTPVCTLRRMRRNGRGGWSETRLNSHSSPPSPSSYPRVRTLGHVHTSPHRKVSEREERSIETETK